MTDGERPGALAALIDALRAAPRSLPAASRYTSLNGVLYLGAGIFTIVWPGAAQTLFGERAFVGDEQGLLRVIGLTIVVIGWLYLFGGRSGGRQVVAATVIDRLIFVPLVLGALALAGVFPRVLTAFIALDAALAIGAWVLLARSR